MKRRSESFFGLHFDFHAQPKYGLQGKSLNEEDIRRICRTLKPDFIQIDCKGHPGWASYPTELGNAMPEFAQDTLALWRRVTREENVALYMHYSGVYDIKYCAEHPEETVLNADGTCMRGTTRTNGRYVDDVLIPQLSELAGKYGVDGVWVDGDCWKATSDFTPETIEAFEKETGIDLGGKLPAKKEDPYYEEFREYNRELFRRYVRHYVDVLHERYPDFQVASNWAFSDHMPEAVCASVDFLSGDLNHANSFNSARYAARALAQQEYPWDLMSWNFRIKVNGRGACITKHPIQLMQEAAAVISLGGAYQDYIMQLKDGSPDTREILRLAPLAEFLRARQPFCFRGSPMHEAALLLSTYDRHREADRLYSRTGFERVMGMTALLCDIGQSLEIVCEHTLEKYINEYKMIVVPELHTGLAASTVSSLIDYARNGGRLVLVGKKTCTIFADASGLFNVVPKNAFFGCNDLAYDNGGETGHKNDATNEFKPFYFTSDKNEFGVAFAPCGIVAEGGQTELYLSEDPYGESFVGAVTLPCEKGSITAVGFDIGEQYSSRTQYMQRKVIREITDRLYTPTVRVESACGRIEIVPLLKDGRLMIQLVNAGGSHSFDACATDDCIPPALDIELSVAMPCKPKALLLQPEGKELPFEYRDGRAYVSIDRVDIHSIIEVCE